MNKVVVTGGNGYVGRALVEQLAGDAGQLHVIDNLASGKHRLDEMDQSSFELHVTDIRDADAVRQTLELINPDVVIHLAAIHYIPLCENNPANAVDVNVNGTVNLLSAMPEGARFVFASSAAVYAPSDTEHVEDVSEVGPMDVYGWTKLHCEHYINHFHSMQRISGVNVRLFNVVGSGETNPHLAPAIIEQLDGGINTIKLGNLFPQRDYINVADVAEGFRRLAAVEIHDKNALVSNLGTGKAFEVGQMVQSIASAAGIELTIEQDEQRIRAVDRPMLKASTKRLEQTLGWKPSISLEQSMVESWATRAEDKLR